MDEENQTIAKKDIAKMTGAELVAAGFTMADVWNAVADRLAYRQRGHTDIFLGDDGRGYAFWKIICGYRVQEVKAPLPKGHRCIYCNELISPTTSVVGIDPEKLVEDTSGVVIEKFTKETVKRVIRDAKDRLGRD